MPDRHADMSAAETELFLRYALRMTKGRLKLVGIAAAAFLLLAIMVLGLLLLVIGDHIAVDGLSDGVRRASRWGLFTSAAVLALWLLVIPLVRRINDLYVARLIEKAHPEFRNSLISALQLRDNAELAPSVRAALLNKATHDLAGSAFQHAVRLRRLKQAAAFAGAAAAMFLAYAAVSPKAVWPSLARLLGSEEPAPTRTVVELIEPADGKSVVVGTPVRFAARVIRGRVEQVSVRFSLDDGQNWLGGHRLHLAPSDGDHDEDVRLLSRERSRPRSSRLWQATKSGKDVQQTMSWQIVAGDAESTIRRLEVRPEPDVIKLTARYQYPGYTALGARIQKGGHLDAPIGTSVELTAITNVPVGDYPPTIVFGREPDTVSRRVTVGGAEDTELTTSLVVNTDDVYRLRFLDAYGVRNKDVVYTIRARRDRPPEIEIRKPARDIELLPNDAMPLAANITDDFGLTDVQIEYRRADEASDSQTSRFAGRRQGRIELRLPGAQAGEEASSESQEQLRLRRVNLDESIPLSRFGAKAGDVIEWELTARDNCRAGGDPAGYQMTRSRTGRILVRGQYELARRDRSAHEEHTAQPELGVSGLPGQAEVDVALSPVRLPATQLASGPEADNLQEFIEQHRAEIDKLSEHLAPMEVGSRAPRQPDQQAGQRAPQGQAPVQPCDPPPPDADDAQGAHEQTGAATGVEPREVPAQGQSVGQGDGAPDRIASADDSRAETRAGTSELRDTADTEQTGAERPSSRESSRSPRQGRLGPDAEALAGRTTGQEREPDGEESATAEGDSGRADRRASQGTGPTETQQRSPQTSDGQAKPDQRTDPGAGQAPTAGSTPSPEGRTHEQQDEHRAETNARGPGGTDGARRDGMPGADEQSQEPGDDEPDAQELSQVEEPPQQGQTRQASGQQDETNRRSAARPGAKAAAQSKDGAEGTSSGRPGPSAAREGPGDQPTGARPDNLLGERGPVDASGQFKGAGSGSAPLETIGRTAKIVDALEQQLRKSKLDPDLLEDLGWSESQAAGFVREFRRLAAGGQAQTERTARPNQATDGRILPPGQAELELGRRADRELRERPVADERVPDGLGKLLEPGEQRVSEEYRELLKAYYETISRDHSSLRPSTDRRSR